MEAKDSDPLLHNGRQVRKFLLTVELPLFAIAFSSTLTDAVTSNLLLYRTCINDLQYNEDKCKLLQLMNKTGEAKELENEVEAHTTLLVMLLSITSGFMPAILSGFLGSWSDRHGRKPLVMWPLFGQIISSLLVVIYSYIRSLNSWWFLVCTLPFALLGGSGAFTLGGNLLVSDNSDDNNRSLRLSLLYGCGFMGVLLGSVSSSYVYEAVGYVYLFSLATFVYTISYFYIWLFVEESLEDITPGRITKLFNLDLVKEAYYVNFKPRRPVIAYMLFLLISVFGITMFTVSGISNVDYFFTRQKFQWLLKEYNIFSAVNTIIIVFGIFVGMAFFQKICKINDGVLLIFSYVSSIADAVVRCFARKSWHMYLAGAMSMLGGLSPPLIRSQIAKIVPKEEVAKLYSLITCVESIVPVLSPLLFSTLYYKTLMTFPAAIYAVSASFFFVCLIFVTIAEVIYYRTPQQYYREYLLDQDTN